MNKMHNINVSIQNKQYTLCGYESEEYIQKIAAYLNSHYEEYKKMDGYRLLDTDMKNILMQINIADELFKEKEKNANLIEEMTAQNEEIYNIKHEVISLHTQYDNAKKEIERLNKELEDASKKIVSLESKGKR